MESSNTKVQLTKNPRKDASIFSIWFYCWVNPLMWKGYKNKLDETDLFQVLDEDRSDYLGDKLEHAWNKELNDYIEKRDAGKKMSQLSKPKLLYVLIKTFGKKEEPLTCFSVYGIYIQPKG